MSWRRWTRLAVGVLGAGVFALPFCTGFTRSLGLHPVAGCPVQPLSSAEVEARFLAGMAKMAEGQLGEYRRGRRPRASGSVPARGSGEGLRVG